jgi:hypothetical protein
MSFVCKRRVAGAENPVSSEFDIEFFLHSKNYYIVRSSIICMSLKTTYDIFQHRYYIPIILAAFWFGFRGGIGTAVVVSILYAPHIIFSRHSGNSKG